MSVGSVGLVTKGIDGTRCGVGQAPANFLQLGKRAANLGVVGAIGEQQDKQVAVGIDPERRSGPAGMSIAVRTEERAGTGSFLTGRQCLPPQGAGADPAVRRYGNLDELVNRFFC